MGLLRQIVLFLHLVAAMFWIGEMLVFSLVVGPVSRKLGDAQKRSELFYLLGGRSRPLIWGAIGLLVATGFGNLLLMRIPLGDLLRASFYHSAWGAALGLKLILVAVLLLFTMVHDLGTAKRRRRPPTADAERLRRYGRLIGRFNLLLALAIVFLGVRLVLL